MGDTLEPNGVPMVARRGVAARRLSAADRARRCAHGCSLDSLEITPIYDDELVAVLPKDHPLARRKSVALRALRNDPWAIDARPNTFSDVVFAMCEKRGFRPRVIGRFDAYDVISALVACGSAVSVLPRIGVTDWEHSGVTWRSLHPAVRRPIRTAVRRNELRRPALAVAVEAIREAAAEISRQPRSPRCVGVSP